MRPPNILIFMTDHQRGDTVLAGHPAQTPHLSRFAEQGVTFTEAFCPSPHCCPSRATFFTGLYPTRHGVWNNVCNRQALRQGPYEGVRLWSEDLAAADYDLRFSGKWHVSALEGPVDRGWTEHFVSSGPGAHHGWTWEQYRALSERSEPQIRGEGGILRPGYPDYTLYGADEAYRRNRHDEDAVKAGLAALAELSAARDPWCLFVGAIGPHDPYAIPGRYLDLYDLEYVPLPHSYADGMRDKPAIYRRLREQIFGQLTESEVREGIRHFWAYCSYLDDLFAQMLAGLERAGQVEDTLVLYVSDHGDYCGEHGLFAKGIPCFRGAYHVPAVIRWPAGVNRPGRRVGAFVSLADFGPTFLEAAGVTPPPDLTGRSLLPFLRDEPPGHWRDELHTQCNGVELYYTQRSVTTQEFKYVFNGFDRDELYDLRDDPDEMRNLAGDPAYAAIVRQMCRRMWRFAAEQDDTAINPYITVGLAPWGPAEAFLE
jgi:arylsulfatase A-like enzyme